MKDSVIKIVIADDHKLFRRGIENIIHALGEEYKVIGEAANGEELIRLLQRIPETPDLAILDINMPGLDGFGAMEWLNQHRPDIKVLVVSMIDREDVILRMIKMGAKGYLSKDIETNDLKRAIDAIMQKGFYYTDYMTGKLVHDLQKNNQQLQKNELNDREKELLRAVCTELTYKEIADQMYLSPKTIDTYRENLFRKLGATSRVGLVIFAIKNGFVQV